MSNLALNMGSNSLANILFEAVLTLFVFFASYFGTLLLIPKLKKAGIVGKDMNKKAKPAVPEMGGIAVILAIYLGIAVAIFVQFFGIYNLGISPLMTSSILLLLFVLGFIGMVDDLIDMPQLWKLLLPIFGAIPLIVLRAAGNTAVFIPFIGSVNFGIFYFLIIVPFAITVSANLTNILAGFNGLEYGISIPMFITVALLGAMYGRPHMTVIGSIALAAFLGFFLLNKYPSKIFPGDAGTLIIGGLLSALVIVDNFESLAIILLIPHLLDLAIKLLHNPMDSSWEKLKKGMLLTLPEVNGKAGWWGELRDGRLYPPGGSKGVVLSLPQAVMKLAGGIDEKTLVNVLIGFEALISLFAILIFKLRLP